MKLLFHAQSDLGRIRTNNEDAFGYLESENLFIVCDGVGGQAHGEVASRLTVDTLIDTFEKIGQEHIAPLVSDILQEMPEHALKLVAALRLANHRVFDTAVKSRQHDGMSTTAVALLLHGHSFIAANIGDSRIYRFANDRLQQITTDHSVENEPERLGDEELAGLDSALIKRMITRAIGSDPVIDIDIAIDAAQSGDRYLLCTDGLHGFVADDVIENILRDNPVDRVAVQKLIDMANENGGKDNITATVVTVESVQENVAVLPACQLTIGKESPKITKIEQQTIDTFFEHIDVAPPDDPVGAASPADRTLVARQVGTAKPESKRGQVAWVFAVLVLLAAAVFVWKPWQLLPKNNIAPAVDSAAVIENNGNGVDSTGIGAETEKEPERDSAPPTNYTSFVDIVTYDNEIKDSATVYLDGQFKGNLLELNGQLPVSADSQHTIEIRWDRQFSPIVSKFTVKPYSRFNIFIDDSLERK